MEVQMEEAEVEMAALLRPMGEMVEMVEILVITVAAEINLEEAEVEGVMGMTPRHSAVRALVARSHWPISERSMPTPSGTMMSARSWPIKCTR
jgi:hypothetical protein